MTGPEHYRKAEQLLEASEAAGGEDGWRPVRQIQLASVHATLALAAGTVLGASPAEVRAWADIAGAIPGDDGTEPGPRH